MKASVRVRKNAAFSAKVSALLVVGVLLLAYGCSQPEPSPGQSAQTPLPATGLTPTPSIQLAACEQPDLISEMASDLEFAGIAGWINSDPLTIQGELSSNNVVLIDFWTYTCVNCIRTLPFLQEWHSKYSDVGLTIIGVHTPEFEFEKVRENIEKAAGEDGVVWPIAIDNDYATWNRFDNRFWPAKYLITPDGDVSYTHFGEGAYCETELAIRAALEEAGRDVSSIPIGEVNNQTRDQAAFTQTRELYGGTLRSTPFNPYAANFEYYEQDPDGDQIIEFQDPGDYVDNFFYLEGLWRREPERIAHARATENLEDYLALTFSARSVNVVLSPESGEPFDVFVYLEDEPLAPGEVGDDIQFDVDGNSFIRVDAPRLYSIIMLPGFDQRVLKLSSNSEDFAVFAFTFGTYESGL